MYIYLDTETTGAGPEERLCQIAFKPENGKAVCGLFSPGRSISIEATVVHHITSKIVADKPPLQESDKYTGLQKLVSDINHVIVPHNAQFDMRMLQVKNITTPRGICTLKLARHLDRKGVNPKDNLQYIGYFLGLEIDATAHDAFGDVLVMEGLFERLKAKFLG